MLVKQKMCQSTGVVAKRVVSQETEAQSEYSDQNNHSCRLRGMAASAWGDTGAVQGTPQPAAETAWDKRRSSCAKCAAAERPRSPPAPLTQAPRFATSRLPHARGFLFTLPQLERKAGSRLSAGPPGSDPRADPLCRHRDRHRDRVLFPSPA